MYQELLKRAEELRSRNRLQETVRGSGYHDEDRDHRGQYLAPQRNGLPRVSEHLIAFYGEYDVLFLGGDAGDAFNRLQAWALKHKEDLYDVNCPGSYRKLLKIIPKQKLEERDGVPVLSLRLLEWNDFLLALYEMGLGISGLPLD